LPDWYRAADVFVLPSRSEGVPNVLLEAMACGRPFVATRVGGIPEIAHLGRGRLVPPGDVRSLTIAVRESLANSPQLPTSQTSIRSHADSAAELASLFEEVIRSRESVAVTRPAAVVAV
jgi:glycosyltransferase involved in cell wall biosynthesis